VIQERKCHFDFKDFKMNMETEETSFFHSLTSLVDEVTIMMDRVKLQLVFGDIAQESSDIIVNSTSFNNPPLGVSKVLLTAAGSEVEQEFENACKRQKNNMVITKAGSLNCKNIVHICWENNLSVIEKRTKEVIELCETLSFRSVSFPAVCTGAGGLKPNAVAKAMLDGISAAVTNQNVNTVSVVRIVLFKKDIFESFKSTVESCYGNTKRNEAAKKMKLKEKKKLKIENYCKPSIDILSLIPDEDVPPALFNVIGWHSKNVKEAKDNLESVFNTVYHEESLQDDNIFSLSVQDIQTLLETAKNKSVHVSVDQHDKSRLLLKGLRDDVIYIVQQVQLLVNSLLKRELEKRNQELVRCDVQWYYHEKNQSTPFTLETNFILEEAFSNNSIQVTVTDESMRMFNINLRKMVATTPDSSEEIELKRIENSLGSILQKKRVVVQKDQNRRKQDDSGTERYELCEENEGAEQ
ncbi:protein mono-ADP-ribosyltransferase PARP14, partial [Polypterus senegalus]|uniref:protein mono-ADP-ribosyltransferase PARP14 n=1 Tax=Polypterus senegalus TaxID=55291 RepID=UPI0019627D76